MTIPSRCRTLIFALWIGLAAAAAAQDIQGCRLLPADNIWNTPVTHLPADPNSQDYIDSLGANGYLHADFGSGEWPPGSGSPIGIPFTVVPGDQTLVDVTFAYDDESDPGPYPIPTDALIEGGPDGTGDRHVLVVDRDHCLLYELFNAYPLAGGPERCSI